MRKRGTAGQSGAGDFKWAKMVGWAVAQQERETNPRWLA